MYVCVVNDCHTGIHYRYFRTFVLNVFIYFFFNDTATTEIYTLSLHDALPIFLTHKGAHHAVVKKMARRRRHRPGNHRDRKSTRLNSSHSQISYAVFCLKKKNGRFSVETDDRVEKFTELLRYLHRLYRHDSPAR